MFCLGNVLWHTQIHHCRSICQHRTAIHTHNPIHALNTLNTLHPECSKWIKIKTNNSGLKSEISHQWLNVRAYCANNGGWTFELSNEPNQPNYTGQRIHRHNSIMSGVGFLANIKTLTPSIRRRRRCEKHHLELYRDQQSVVPCWDAIPAPPITPPAAFLAPGFKRLSTVSKSSNKGMAIWTCVRKVSRASA